MTYKISRSIVRETPEMLKGTKILSASTIKRLVVEKGRILKRKKRVRSCKFQRNCKLQLFILKLQVENYELSQELKSSPRFPESKFETASCKSFYG